MSRGILLGLVAILTIKKALTSRFCRICQFFSKICIFLLQIPYKCVTFFNAKEITNGYYSNYYSGKRIKLLI